MGVHSSWVTFKAICTIGSKHNENIQNKCQMSDIINQNWYIYIFPFEITTMMARIVLFHSYECQETQIQNPFSSILCLVLSLWFLKMIFFKFNFHSKIHLCEKVILKQNDMESMLLPYFISFGPNLN
jgi:hypothetical protein